MNGACALVGTSVVFQKGIASGSAFVIEKHNVDSLNWILECTSNQCK